MQSIIVRRAIHSDAGVFIKYYISMYKSGTLDKCAIIVIGLLRLKSSQL